MSILLTCTFVHQSIQKNPCRSSEQHLELKDASAVTAKLARSPFKCMHGQRCFLKQACSKVEKEAEKSNSTCKDYHLLLQVLSLFCTKLQLQLCTKANMEDRRALYKHTSTSAASALQQRATEVWLHWLRSLGAPQSPV